MNRYSKVKHSSLLVSGAVVLVIGVAVYFSWISLSSDSPSGGTPGGATGQGPTFMASGDRAARKIEIGTSEEASAMSEREKAEIVESFREGLNRLEQLRAKAKDQRKELTTRMPNPNIVADYGRVYSIQIEEKYGEYVSAMEGKVPPGTFDALIGASYETRYPQFLLQLADSEEDVAGTPMRAIVRSLFDEIDLRAVILDQMAGLKGIDTQALQKAEGTDAILAELRRLAPELDKQYTDKSAKLLPPDPRYARYLDDQFRSHVVQNVVNTYKSARMVEIEQTEQEARKVATDLNALLRGLPVLSEERVRLATDFSATLRRSD